MAVQGLSDFADWVYEQTGYPVVLDLGEVGSPEPPRPYLVVRHINRKIRRLAAPKATTEDPVTGKWGREHKVLLEYGARVSCYATTEQEARDVLETLQEAILMVDGSESLFAKKLAVDPVSEIIDLGPGEEIAFLDLNVRVAKAIEDSVYVIERVRCPVTTT